MLPQTDLKSVRLVSHIWDEAAQRLLFQSVILKVNLRSFEKLQDISKHHKLSKHVRAISYDGRTLSVDPVRKGFTDWLQFCAGSNLGFFGSVQDNFMEQFSMQQLQDHYFNYCQYLFGQEHILRRGNEQKLLVDALRLLPRLERVEYAAPQAFDGEFIRVAPPLASLSRLAQEILTEPDSVHGYRESEGHFWTLLQSAYLSGRGKTLCSVQGSDLDLERWNTIATSSRRYYKALPALRHLCLEFELVLDDDVQTTSLADMVANLPSLLSLRLSFDYLSFENPYASINLSQIVDSTLTWQYLSKLSLQAVVTTEEFIRDLLSRHANTLRSLELSNIRFKVTTASRKREKQGYWVRFILFLGQDMSLTHIKFNGAFSNSWDEGWTTSDADDRRHHRQVGIPTEWPTDCLKYRIERYITKGAECPFRPRTENDSGDCWDGPSYRLPWVFQEDDSWTFEPRLII